MEGVGPSLRLILEFPNVFSLTYKGRCPGLSSLQGVMLDSRSLRPSPMEAT